MKVSRVVDRWPRNPGGIPSREKKAGIDSLKARVCRPPLVLKYHLSKAPTLHRLFP